MYVDLQNRVFDVYKVNNVCDRVVIVCVGVSNN